MVIHRFLLIIRTARVFLFFSMHTLTAPGTPTRAAAPAASARVAVAGATGYTGQELLRLLARHPGVSIDAAMSSGSAAGAERRLPALAHVWDGAVAPLSPEQLRGADLVF